MKRCAYAYGMRTESVLWSASRPDPTRPDPYKYLSHPSISPWVAPDGWTR